MPSTVVSGEESLDMCIASTARGFYSDVPLYNKAFTGYSDYTNAPQNQDPFWVPYERKRDESCSLKDDLGLEATESYNVTQCVEADTFFGYDGEEISTAEFARLMKLETEHQANEARVIQQAKDKDGDVGILLEVYKGYTGCHGEQIAQITETAKCFSWSERFGSLLLARVADFDVVTFEGEHCDGTSTTVIEPGSPPGCFSRTSNSLYVIDRL